MNVIEVVKKTEFGNGSMPGLLLQTIAMTLLKAKRMFYFQLPCAPPTVNNQMRRAGNRFYMQKVVLDFRALVHYHLRAKKFDWDKAPDTCSIVVALESPNWLTKDFKKVRKQDLDNQLKALLDAIEKATGVADQSYFNIHAFKIPSKHTRTSVWLFDLGGCIEYYS